MAIGFIRPHTPLIVPQRFFDRFPLEDVELPEIRPGMWMIPLLDSFVVYPMEKNRLLRGPRTGLKAVSESTASYSNAELGLKHFIQPSSECGIRG